MTPLDKKPSEELYIIEFKGAFLPDNIQPKWFAENKLLGKEEASNVSILDFTPKERTAFSTEFIVFDIQQDKIRLTANQFLSFDLVQEMASNLSKILRNSIFPFYELKVRLHYTMESKGKFNKTLNRLGNIESLAAIIEKPQIEYFSFKIPNKEKKNYILHSDVHIFPCNREDMKNTLHLYLNNKVEIKQNSTVSQVIDNDNNTLNNSITLVNKLLKAYF